MRRAQRSVLTVVVGAHVLLGWALGRLAPAARTTELNASPAWVRLLDSVPPTHLDVAAVAAGPPKPSAAAAQWPVARTKAQANMQADTQGATVQRSPVDAIHEATLAPPVVATASGEVDAPASMQAVEPPPSNTPAQVTTAQRPAEHAHCPPAPHPVALRDRGIEGRVSLRVHVGTDGRATEVRVLGGGSGWRLFDDAATSNALRCVFVPASRNGQAVDSWVEFPVRFALADGGLRNLP